MPSGVFLGFDYGLRRIGVAVGQAVTRSANPLTTLLAKQGVPDWHQVKRLMTEWRPHALVVGLPTCINGSEQYITALAKTFADELHTRFERPVHLVDERLTTKEARSRLFEEGGYSKLKSTEIDGIAACLILEQWLQIQE